MTDHIAPIGPTENRPTALRTHLCGVLRAGDEGARVRVCGWVGRRREHGEHLAFIDLRDHTGVIQCVIDTKVDVRSEWVIAIEGTVRRRPEGTVNPGLATGEIEIGDCTVVVLNEAEPPPFSVDDRDESDEQVRLRYRYVDLRRPRMQRNLRLRARVNAAIRAAMDRQGFCEVETPLLWAPTPEGSREFSVPSRLHHGSFYALPQSPQLAKQLLMVGGFDRYYQIARCLRDEDLRADRQFEFSQLDMEVSFATQDDVMAYVSEAVLDAAEAATGERPPPIARMTWADALERFGTDKPDLRFGMELVDLAVEFAHTEVRAFSGSHLKAMCVPGGGLVHPLAPRCAGRAGQAGGRRRAGLVPGHRRPTAGTGSPSIRRSTASCRRSSGRPSWRRPGRKEGDLILAVSDTHRIACTTLGTLRVALGSPPVGRGPAPLCLGRRLPHVRRGRRRAATRSRPTTRSPCRTRRTWPCSTPSPSPCARRPTTSSSTAGSWDRAASVSTAGTSSRGSSTRSGSAPKRPRAGSASSSARSATAPRRMPASPSASTAWWRCWPGRRTSAR